MAQTKRKRKTKHRGNAAGMIETRGRTGRPLTASEKTADAKARQQLKREERLNSPPTWKSSINRAAIAGVIFFVALLLLFKEGIGPTLGLTAFVFLLYIPLGYYTDFYIFRWRMKKKDREAAAAKAAKSRKTED